MQGYVIAPPAINNYINDCPKIIANYFAELLNLQVITDSQFSISSITSDDIVISMAIPSQSFAGEWNELPSRTIFIYWMDDGQWRSDSNRQSMQRTLERADAIIYCNKSQFNSLWYEYKAKAYWLPLFATPEFELPYNENPEMICAMSGNSTKKWYPIRYKVASTKPPNVAILEHPGYNQKRHDIIGAKYAKWLNNYFCSVTDSSNNWATLKYDSNSNRVFTNDYMQQYFTNVSMNYGQVLKKYFEIPMTGSLLLADNNTPEMADLGFNDTCFVPVTEHNVLDKINDCLANPDKYEQIRANGYAMAHKKHTWTTRKSEAYRIIAEIFRI